MNDIQTISLDLIEINPYQPRLSEDPEHVQAIADSIESAGLLQIPSGRWNDQHKVELAFGMTRFSAMKLLRSKQADDKFASMPVNIVEFSDLQMFEAAVTENVRRKDLNHIERATAMARYMDEFASTSAQVGELFGVNESTVRGALRLLELPQSAKDGVADGTIAIGTARQLLTLQKLAPAYIDETVKNLVAGRVDSQDPKKLIDKMIRKGALEIWESWRDGEPKAGKGLWALDYEFSGAFDFPLFKDFEKAYTGAEKLGRGWDLQGAFNRTNLKFNDEDPNQLPGIQYGGRAFDVMRKEHPEITPVVDLVDHLVNPPNCAGCQFHAVVDRSHFCGLPLCHTRKRERWTADAIKRFSHESLISIYDAQSDGAVYDWLEHSWGNDEQVFDEHKDSLRLKVKFTTSWDTHPFTDSNEFGVVVIGEIAQERKDAEKRRKAEEAARKKAEKEARATEDPFRWEKRRAGYEIIRPMWRSILWDLATETHQDVIGTHLSFGVLDTLTDAYSLNLPDGVEPDNESAIFLSVFLVYGMLSEYARVNVGEDADEPLAYLDENVRELYKNWGKALPANWTNRIDVASALYQGELEAAFEKIEAKAVEA